MSSYVIDSNKTNGIATKNDMQIKERKLKTQTLGQNPCQLRDDTTHKGLKIIIEHCQKLKTQLSYELVTPLPHIYLKHLASYSTDTSLPMFTAALSTIARKWIKPTGHSTHKCIMKICYICTIELYSAAIKKSWNFQVNVYNQKILSGITQTLKDKSQLQSYLQILTPNLQVCFYNLHYLKKPGKQKGSMR